MSKQEPFSVMTLLSLSTSPPHPITMSTVGNAKGSLRENELSMHHKSGLGYYFLMLGSLVRLWSLW